MRAAWTLVMAMALGCGSSAPPPAAPAGPSPCARASDRMVQTMLAHLSTKDAPPTETADAMRNLIRERCEQDAWSAAAVQCLIAMKSQDDAAGCAQQMTEAQQAALVRDEQAKFAAPPAQ
jgi:hypothetical protein